MIITFFIGRVFLAELFLAVFLFIKLIEISKKTLLLNEFFDEACPKLREICFLMNKISSQILEYTLLYKRKLDIKKEQYAIGILNQVLILFVSRYINIKFLKRIKKNRFFKGTLKGFNILKSMV